MTNEQVADGLGWSPSKVSRYERARSSLKPEDVQEMLAFYNVPAGRQDVLLALAREAESRGWWEDYRDILKESYFALIGLEDEAVSTLSWHIDVLPGLLQTEAYARQVNARGISVGPVPSIPPSRLVERSVQVRMKRQQLLTRDPPLRLSALIDESVLIRGVADSTTMRDQMRKLAKISELPNVSLRVVPLKSGYPIINSFDLLEFGEDQDAAMASMLFTEHLQNEMFFDGEVDIYYYRLMFERLAEDALDQAQSLALIAHIAETVWEDEQ
jgi:transcriptional regulator with XRE-family HTH domain